MNDPIESYLQEITDRVAQYPDNQDLQDAKVAFFNQIGVGRANYIYNFTWAGVPIVQIPQDLMVMQEIIWKTKPDLIIETGVAWGGSLMFSASMLATLQVCGEIENAEVVGIDIDIRQHNKARIAAHPLSKFITLVEGSSVEAGVVDKVKAIASRHKRVMICLDSNHTHDHVLEELRAYAPLVTKGNYCVVSDTLIEDAPADMSPNRPWCKGNNPKTAVWKFMDELAGQSVLAQDGEVLSFQYDRESEHKIVITGSPDGYLVRT